MVEYYYTWKTTEAYLYYRVNNSRGAHRKLRRTMLEGSAKPFNERYSSDDSAGQQTTTAKKKKKKKKKKQKDDDDDDGYAEKMGLV